MAGKISHKKVSAVSDAADTSKVRPSNWNESLNMSEGDDGNMPVRDSTATDGWTLRNFLPIGVTNNTGVTLAIGDVVALDGAIAESAVLEDLASSVKRFVVAATTSINAARGMFAQYGQVASIKVTGTVSPNHWLVKSATSRAAEDSGFSNDGTNPPPIGAFAISTSANAGGFCSAYLVGYTHATTSAFVVAIMVRNLFPPFAARR